MTPWKVTLALEVCIVCELPPIHAYTRCFLLEAEPRRVGSFFLLLYAPQLQYSRWHRDLCSLKETSLSLLFQPELENNWSGEDKSQKSDKAYVPKKNDIWLFLVLFMLWSN